MSQDPTVQDNVQTQNKTMVPARKSMESKYGTRQRMDTDLQGAQGNNETMLVSVMGGGHSTPAS